MENLSIFHKYVLIVLYSILCLYIGLKSYSNSIQSFKMVIIRDEYKWSDMFCCVIYVFIGQLAVVTDYAFCNMFSINFIHDDALDWITHISDFIFAVIASYMLSIQAFLYLEKSLTELLKRILFRVCFSLIFISSISNLMKNITNGIKSIQVLCYEEILEIDKSFMPLFILIYSLLWLDILLNGSEIVQTMAGDTDA